VKRLGRILDERLNWWLLALTWAIVALTVVGLAIALVALILKR
jgi:hypothetical protein